MKKILILAANPTGTSKLRLDEEVREIQNAHRKGRKREEIEIFSEWAVQVDDLRQTILYYKPNIVHFSGHGEGDDGLVLENEYGKKQLVSSESLAGLFKFFKNHVDCVVLNACYSEVQAEAIHEHINCVIGMNQSIGDKAAIEFATGFYEALTSGRNYQDSLGLGCNAIDLKNIPESQTPQFKIKDNSKSLLLSNSTDNKSSQVSDFEPIKNIPNRGSHNFVGREDELVEIHTLLQENNSLAISAVSGMGGVGKTELAIQYAQRYDNYYPGGICWLNARGTSLAAEILQFIQLQMGLEVPQTDFQENALTLEQQVSWCWQNWKPQSGLVLVVFDDVISLEGFPELLPALKRFRVLMTTRLRDMETNFEEMHLDVLSEEEALELLTKLLGKNGERKVYKELETAQELCKWLGYLPLGIELVGRYIKKKPPHFTLKKMLQQLQQQRLDTEAINNSQQQTLSTAQRGVLDAFEISWVELSPQTREVAALLSLFAGDIFDWGWVESMSKSLNWDESDVEIAIEQLFQRHLVQCLEEKDEECGYYYQIHPLIREFLKTKLQASAQIKELKQAFASTLIEIGQTIPENATLEFLNSVKNAIPHLEEVIENHLDAVSDENLYSAFLGLGKFYEGKGLYNLAEPWFEQSVSIVRSRLGENHRDYAQSLNDLASIYHHQGKYDKAEPLYIQALELRKQLFGVNHPDVAESLKNLAILYKNQGKYEQAEPLYIQALELTKQLVGENHPHTATNLSNLAVLYSEQGKYEQAESLCIQALELTKQLLGENHLDTATSLNNLAILYCEQGKYEQAEPLYIQALELTKQLQGVNHPHTAKSLNNLACIYSEQGKYEQAEPLNIQALELRKQLLGVNHPDTANSLNNLALLYSEQGKYEQSEPLHIQALELTKQLQGVNHPHTAGSLNNLAVLYLNQGRYDKAEPLFIEVVELFKQLLGENHPDTATSLNNLAKLYLNQGKYEQAEPLFIQALELRKQLQGVNHSHTAGSLNNLALLYSGQRRYDEAEPLFIQAVEIAELVLGENHPKTVKYRGDLEDFRRKQGESGSSEQ